MKDLSEYIETLIDEVNLPLEIRLQEDGAYRINVHTDLKGSWVLFQRAFERTEGDVRFIRVQLKTYLPQLEFVVKVNYTNYPKDFGRIPLLHEYKIKTREHYNK
jgi:hypothetical protein